MRHWLDKAIRGLCRLVMTIFFREVEVVGTERVEVPAGAFDAYKVMVTSDQSESTMWISTELGKAVKSVTSLPQMNGAVATSELLE